MQLSIFVAVIDMNECLCIIEIDCEADLCQKFKDIFGRRSLHGKFTQVPKDCLWSEIRNLIQSDSFAFNLFFV